MAGLFFSSRLVIVLIDVPPDVPTILARVTKAGPAAADPEEALSLQRQRVFLAERYSWRGLSIIAEGAPPRKAGMLNMPFFPEIHLKSPSRVLTTSPDSLSTSIRTVWP